MPWHVPTTSYNQTTELQISPAIQNMLNCKTLTLCYRSAGQLLLPLLYSKEAEKAYVLRNFTDTECESFLSKRKSPQHQVRLIAIDLTKTARFLIITYSDSNASRQKNCLQVNMLKIHHLYHGEPRPIREYVGEGGYTSASDSDNDCIDLTGDD